MQDSRWHRNYPLVLFVFYLAVWLWAAINPLHRDGWLLENYLIFLAVPCILWSWWKFRLSNISYTLVFIFMVLHTIGSHYTYADVPFGYWLQNVFDLSRNHYDRIVHFSFGFLLAYPMREIFLRLASARGVWGLWFPVELTMGLSALYEVIEWLAAIWTNPQAGLAFLGSQGDVWDAQKDMALASSGAAIAMIITGFIRWHKDRKYGAEMERSIEDKKGPQGEVALKRLSKRNGKKAVAKNS